MCGGRAMGNCLLERALGLAVGLGRVNQGASDPVFLLQGTRAEHVPVPASLRGGWLHHSPGVCLPHSRQHFPRAAPQEGKQPLTEAC